MSKASDIKAQIINDGFFYDKTYVAFLDISGFKSYMKENRSEEVINDFYEVGTAAIEKHNHNVEKIEEKYGSIERIGKLFQGFKETGELHNFPEAARYTSVFCPLKLNGIFLSDCAIIYFEKDYRCVEDYYWAYDLERLLGVIREINIDMLRKDHLLTCSIAYGQFNYSQKEDYEGIKQHAIIGDGYVEAYYDNEYGIPKINPGECRIVLNTLPP